MAAERIYQRLPVALQQTACSLEGWRIQRERYGGGFREQLRAAEERGNWPADRLEDWRQARLREFLRHAVAGTEHYGGVATKGRGGETMGRGGEAMGCGSEAMGCGSEAMGCGSEASADTPPGSPALARFPVLEKETVREQPLLFRAAGYRPGELKTVHTSGTTGAGLRFWATPGALQEQWAIWWRYRRWHGLEPGTLCGYFGGRSVVPLAQSGPPYWRYDLAGRQIFFSGYHLRDGCLEHYVNELRRARPPWLHGYPSLLALVASYVLDRGLDLGYRVRWITTGAENLLAQQRALIERAFGVRPRQHYGMAEAVANASECEHGRLHVDEDFSLVELVPVSGSTPDGPLRVVGTNFSNPATPLIRYAVADHARWSSAGDCPCGRPGRVIESIDGRREDYIVLEGGTRLGRLDHVFKDLTAIREAQLVQERVGEVRVRVVRGTGYTDGDEARLRQELGARLGTARYQIEYTDRLERSATGKLRLVVSRLPAGQLES